MVNDIDEKRLKFNVFYFSGVRTEDINHCIIPIIKKHLDYLILHVGTMMPQPTQLDRLNDLFMLKFKILLSIPIIRHDNGKANLVMRNVNKHQTSVHKILDRKNYI